MILSMTLTEAMAVYLTMMHKPARTQQEERAFQIAWGVIFREGERIAMFHDSSRS